jgi:hypothetical protein
MIKGTTDRSTTVPAICSMSRKADRFWNIYCLHVRRCRVSIIIKCTVIYHNCETSSITRRNKATFLHVLWHEAEKIVSVRSLGTRVHAKHPSPTSKKHTVFQKLARKDSLSYETQKKKQRAITASLSQSVKIRAEIYGMAYLNLRTNY